MNRAELRAAIARKNITKTALAEALGISRTAFAQKMSGAREFKESEIRKLVDILELTPDAVNAIFLG